MKLSPSSGCSCPRNQPQRWYQPGQNRQPWSAPSRQTTADCHCHILPYCHAKFITTLNANAARFQLSPGRCLLLQQFGRVHFIPPSRAARYPFRLDGIHRPVVQYGNCAKHPLPAIIGNTAPNRMKLSPSSGCSCPRNQPQRWYQPGQNRQPWSAPSRQTTADCHCHILPYCHAQLITTLNANFARFQLSPGRCLLLQQFGRAHFITAQVERPIIHFDLAESTGRSSGMATARNTHCQLSSATPPQTADRYCAPDSLQLYVSEPSPNWT